MRRELPERIPLTSEMSLKTKWVVMEVNDILAIVPRPNADINERQQRNPIVRERLAGISVLALLNLADRFDHQLSHKELDQRLRNPDYSLPLSDMGVVMGWFGEDGLQGSTKGNRRLFRAAYERAQADINSRDSSEVEEMVIENLDALVRKDIFQFEKVLSMRPDVANILDKIQNERSIPFSQNSDFERVKVQILGLRALFGDNP